MNLSNKFDNEICPLIIESLSNIPNNKRSTLIFDDLKIYSGFIQWYAELQVGNKIQIEKGKRRSSLLLNDDNIVEKFNIFDTDEKKANLKKIHDKGQIIIGEMVDEFCQYVKSHPTKNQSQISKDLGFTKEKYNDNNWIIYTLGRIAEKQGMIKVRKDINKTYFDFIKDKVYQPILFSIKNGQSQSMLEAKLACYLLENNYEFKQQCKFKECSHIKPLPFDFYVKLHDEIELLIEVNGKQHYEFVEYFHRDKNNFDLQIKKDKIKKEYAQDNYEFLEIRYDDNIVQTFKNKINELEVKYEI